MSCFWWDWLLLIVHRSSYLTMVCKNKLRAWILSSKEDYLLLVGSWGHSNLLNTVNNVSGLRLSWVPRCLGAVRRGLRTVYPHSYSFKVLEIYHDSHFPPPILPQMFPSFSAVSSGFGNASRAKAAPSAKLPLWAFLPLSDHSPVIFFYYLDSFSILSSWFLENILSSFLSSPQREILSTLLNLPKLEI